VVGPNAFLRVRRMRRGQMGGGREGSTVYTPRSEQGKAKGPGGRKEEKGGEEHSTSLKKSNTAGETQPR